VAIDSPDPTAIFRTKAFGYDKDQVRSFLEQAASDYARALEEVAWLRQELADAVAKGAPPQPPDMPTAQFAQVLASAHRVAADLKQEAELAAAQMRREAHDEAVHLRQQAEADASALVRTAGARLEEIKADIEKFTAWRAAVQRALGQTADRLNEIAGDMRGAAASVPADAPDEEHLQTVRP
jgi:DivIVA domain-containing protein